LTILRGYQELNEIMILYLPPMSSNLYKQLIITLNL
jgi:hypothetical protein